MGALELGHDPEHGHQEAQVRGHRRLQHQLPVGQVLDLRVEGIDGLVTRRQLLDHIAVAGQEGLGRPGQVPGDHGEQFDDLSFDGRELMLKFLSMQGHSQSL
jgi:hypothetical protein